MSDGTPPRPPDSGSLGLYDPVADRSAGEGFPDREFSTQAPYPPAPCGYSTALGVSGWWRRAWQSLPRWWRVRPLSARVGGPAPRAWLQIPTSDSPGIGAASWRPLCLLQRRARLDAARPVAAADLRI